MSAGVPGGPGRGSFNLAEVAFLDRVTELMESTGKPIINVPLRPLEAATFPGGARHDPVILYSPVAAVRALAAMACYGEYVAGQQDPPALTYEGGSAMIGSTTLRPGGGLTSPRVSAVPNVRGDPRATSSRAPVRYRR